MVEFNPKYCQLGDLEGRIKNDGYVDDDFLLETVRGIHGNDVPPAIVEYMCKRIEGSVKRPRGRKRKDPGHDESFRLIKLSIYRHYLEWVKKRISRYGHVTGLGNKRADKLLLHYMPNEIAATMTAQRLGMGKDAWRTLQNQVISR